MTHTYIYIYIYIHTQAYIYIYIYIYITNKPSVLLQDVGSLQSHITRSSKWMLLMQYCVYTTLSYIDNEICFDNWALGRQYCVYTILSCIDNEICFDNWALGRQYCVYTMLYCIDNEICFDNWALGRPASQSTTNADMTAGRAVDGISYCNIGWSFSQTLESDSYPWWMVDLESVIKVTAVKLYYRLDCCRM